jgi:hypothetical protein
MSKFILGTFCAAFIGLAYLGPAQADRADRHVRIINDTSRTMIHFYASNVRRGTWEEDILGRDVLEPGQSVNVNIDDGTGYCMFDLRAEFNGGRYAERRRFNVCDEVSWTVTTERCVDAAASC